MRGVPTDGENLDIESLRGNSAQECRTGGIRDVSMEESLSR